MWCLKDGGGGQAVDVDVLSRCSARNEGCARAIVCEAAEKDLGPLCSVQCTIHKVAVYKRQDTEVEPRAWDWILGHTKLLHVELAPAGAEHRVKRTNTGKLLQRKDGDAEDVWVWGHKEGEGSEGADSKDLFDEGEEFPAFDVQAGCEVVLRVREGAADWRRRDEPLQLLGETTFTVDEDVLPAAIAWRGDGALGEDDTPAAVNFGDGLVLSGSVSLPFVLRSRVTGIASMTVRLACSGKEQEEWLLERYRRPAPLLLSYLSCAEECLPCDERRGTDVGPLPTKPSAVSKHWSPHARFNRRFGQDQMAEEMVGDSLVGKRLKSRGPQPTISKRAHGVSKSLSQQIIGEIDDLNEEIPTEVEPKARLAVPATMPSLPNAAKFHGGYGGQALMSLQPPAWLFGHSNTVTCCAVFPDGDRVVTGSVDRTVKVWSTAGGFLCRNFAAHSARIDVCKVTPCGQRVVSIAADGVGYVWWADSAERIVTLNGAARCCQIFHTGDKAVTALAEPTEAAAIFDLITGSMTRLVGHTGAVLACTLFPKGNKILTVGSDHEGIIWSGSDGSRMRALSGHVAAVTCCAIAPSGEWLITGSEDTTGKMWPKGDDNKFFRLPPWTFRSHLAAVRACAVVLNGAAALTVGDDRRGFIWSADGSKMVELRGHQDPITACAVFPSGREVLTSVSGGRECIVWSCVSGRQLSMLKPNRFAASSPLSQPKGGDAPPPPPDSAESTADHDAAAGEVVELAPSRGSGDSREVDDQDEESQSRHFPGICAVMPDGSTAMTAWEDGTATIWPRSSLFGLVTEGVGGYWTSALPARASVSVDGAFQERNVKAI